MNKEMKEIHISKFTASRLVKQYYDNYYDDIINIKAKPKIENGKLVIVIKKQTTLNKRNILLTERLNQKEISSIIHDYMLQKACIINSISFEPNYHNLHITYYGNEFDLTDNKKGYQKILEA